MFFTLGVSLYVNQIVYKINCLKRRSPVKPGMTRMVKKIPGQAGDDFMG